MRYEAAEFLDGLRVDRPNTNPGQYERLLGEEHVRTYVPLELRPWVMDCAHKELVHLGWHLARVTQVLENEDPAKVTHTIKLMDLGRQLNVKLTEQMLTTDELRQETGTWSWHVHITAKDVKKYLYTHHE
ncbi:unnamed protein product [Pylaiella littoralis]